MKINTTTTALNRILSSTLKIAIFFTVSASASPTLNSLRLLQQDPPQVGVIRIGTAGRKNWTEFNKTVAFTITTSVYKVAKFGQFFGIIWRVIELVCVLIMVFDVLQRLSGTPKKFMSVFRYIVFSFTAVTPMIIGEKFTLSYRGIIGILYEEWYEQMYYGYFYTGYVNFFQPIVNSSGRDYPKYFHIGNVLFFEYLIFFVLILAAMALRSKLKYGLKIAHFFASLKIVWIMGVMFPFVAWSFWWFKQHGIIRDEVKEGQTWDRGNFGYIVGFALALFGLWEVVHFFISLILTNLQYAKNPHSFPKHKDRKLGYQQTNREEQRSSANLRETTPNPGNGEQSDPNAAQNGGTTGKK